MGKIAMFMVLPLSIFGSVFAGADDYKTTEIYDSLREKVLSLTPKQLGDHGKGPLLCVLMETGYPDAVVTLVAAADGSASLYFSNGGGMIGAGEYPQGRAATLSLVESAQKYLDKANPTKTHPLPKKGYTRFYFITPTGTRTIQAGEDGLGNMKHEFSPLFHTAHELIRVMRLIDEARRSKGTRPDKGN